MFRRRVFAEILQDMVEHVRLNTPLTDFRVGSVIRTLLEAAALEDDEAYFQMAQLLRDFSFTSATGSGLDRRLADFDLAREPAQPALGEIVVNAPRPVLRDTPIPAPLTVYCDATPDHPRVELVTTRNGLMPAGATASLPIPIVATVPGAHTNIAAGQIAFLRSPVPGLEGATCENPISTSGGRDAETDDDFRARARWHIRALPRATPQALEGKAIGVRAFAASGDLLGQVSSALLREERPGESTLFILDATNRFAVSTETLLVPETVTAAATPGTRHLRLAHAPIVPATLRLTIRSPGVPATLALAAGDPALDIDDTTGVVTVGVLPADHAFRDASGRPAAGLAGGALVTAGYAYFTGLIGEVQRVLNGDPLDPIGHPGWKAAGTRVRVRFPAIREIGVRLIVTPREGHAREDLLGPVAAVVEQYINGLPLGAEVVLARIVALAMGVPGVFDVTALAPTGNVAVLEDEIARAPRGSVVAS